MGVYRCPYQLLITSFIKDRSPRQNRLFRKGRGEKKKAYLTHRTSAVWYTTKTEEQKGVGFIYKLNANLIHCFIIIIVNIHRFHLAHCCCNNWNRAMIPLSSESSSTTANFQWYLLWKHHLVSETYQTCRRTHTFCSDLFF